MKHKVVFEKTKKECIVTWQGGYKLTHYEPGDFLEIKGQEKIFTANEITKASDILILGEVGGGASIFLDWLKDRLKHPYVIVDGDWTDDDAISRSDKVNEEKEKNVMAMLQETLERRGTKPLKKWANNISPNCTLVFHSLIPVQAKVLAAVLRTLREKSSKEAQKLKIIILSTSTDLFLEEALQSSYLDYCHVYRLPRFDAEETRDLLQKSINIPGPQNKEQGPIMESIMKYTGGQPALVKSLQKRLCEYNNAKLDHTLLDIVFDDITNAQNFFLEQWKTSLEDLLKKHPASEDILRRYTRESLQSDRLPPPSHDRTLYTAGWLGLKHDGTWGIVSDFHRSIISRVLKNQGVEDVYKRK